MRIRCTHIRVARWFYSFWLLCLLSSQFVCGTQLDSDNPLDLDVTLTAVNWINITHDRRRTSVVCTESVTFMIKQSIDIFDHVLVSVQMIMRQTKVGPFGVVYIYIFRTVDSCVFFLLGTFEYTCLFFVFDLKWWQVELIETCLLLNVLLKATFYCQLKYLCTN